MEHETLTLLNMNDLHDLEIEGFEVQDLDELDVHAPEGRVSICSSTTSASCG